MTVAPTLGFNGATAMKPWKRPCRLWKSSRWGSCFNGATAMKPWKSGPPQFVAGAHLELQWGHGDEAVEEFAPPTDDWDRAELQWGHGDEAVEEPETQIPNPGVARASMGPRR